MLVDVHFHYEALVRRRRKRSDEDAIFRDRVPVQVGEPSASEAPVALRVTDPNERGMIELRWFEDKLWRVMEPTYEDARPRDAAWLAEVCREPNVPGNPLAAGPEPKRGVAQRVEDDIGVVRLIDTDRDDIAARITELSRDVMLLDGAVWTSVPEPHLSFRTSRHHDGPGADLRLEPCDDDTPFDVYRLDELSLIAPSHAETLSDGEEPSCPEFEILIPECLQLRTTESAVAHAARELLGDMRVHLGDNEVDFFLAFNGLKKAHAAFVSALEGPAKPDMGVILEALGEAVEANKRRLAASWHGQVFVDPGVASALARVELQGLDADAFAGIAP